MTVRDLHKRMTNLMEMNTKEGKEHYNELEVWVAVQISPRRKLYFPVTAIWGGCLTIPKPDNNLAGYKDNVRCIEIRTDEDSKVIIKN